MSYTLHTTTAAATGLIAQPGRAVNTFASGLVRVDQTYIGRTANATAHRAILAVGNDMPDGDTSPCIDGLKIFPEAQERRREDGFTEYIVSAYGRSNSTGSSYMLGWQRSAMYGWHGTWHPNIANPDSNGLVLDFNFSFGNFNTSETMTKSGFANVYPPTVAGYSNLPSLVVSQNTSRSEAFYSNSGYDQIVPVCSSISSSLSKKYIYGENWYYEFSLAIVLANSIPAYYSNGDPYPQYSLSAGTTYNIGKVYLSVKPETSRSVNYFGDFLDINTIQNFSFLSISIDGLTASIPNQ